MGIVNVTPDSFSDGGAFFDPARAVEHALQLARDGAAILDIGGESTRPGAGPVPVDEELERVIPVIRALANETAAILSIDTRKPEVAEVAIAAGAQVWNDVSALTFSERSLETAARLDCRLVLMHAQGEPKTMQAAPHYDDVVAEVCDFLIERASAAEAAGVARDRIFIDPGIGFGKTVDHNLALLAGLDRFVATAYPVLLGASRKRFIAAVDRDGAATMRVGGSLAAALAGAAAGVRIVRVHDVAETRQALSVAAAIEGARK
jgi:dihydropteroate synthase